MSAKQSRKARSIAMAEARRVNLWKQGEKSLFSKWTLRFFAWISRAKRKEYTDAIGRWYKATVKAWSKRVAEAMRDQDTAEFRRVQMRMKKKEAKARAYIAKMQGVKKP